jgi:hypothetical protein
VRTCSQLERPGYGRSLRSAIDCLFFLTCEGSPTSREEYPEGIVATVVRATGECRVRAVTTPDQPTQSSIGQLEGSSGESRAGGRESLTYVKRRSRGGLRSAALAIRRGELRRSAGEAVGDGDWQLRKEFLPMGKGDFLARRIGSVPKRRPKRSSQVTNIEISPQGNLCAQIGKKVQVASSQ